MLEHLAQARAAQSPSARFSALLGQIQPASSEVAAYLIHKRTLETRLQQQFSAPAVEIIGSHSRGTAIRGVSDMDLLVRDLALESAPVHRGEVDASVR